MPIDTFLKSVEATGFATTIRDSIWMFPIIESIHVISFTLVVGTIAIIDLRLLGLASVRRSFRRMSSDILKWTWAAFALAVVTGLMMFSTNARVYYHNPFFRTKMILLVFAGLNMLVFELTAGRTIQHWDSAPSAPRAGKAVAVLSLAIWIGIIFMGRIIGFTTHPGSVAPPTPGVNYDNFLLPPASGTSTSGPSGTGSSGTTPAPTPNTPNTQ
ncbi:MAG TPA: DUF6644 family protein [Candidatus Dormibacteraeota bacterium]|nr:DUF6644 family protein [Candidatus Dormibacteraeota bacterium]